MPQRIPRMIGKDDYREAMVVGFEMMKAMSFKKTKKYQFLFVTKKYGEWNITIERSHV